MTGWLIAEHVTLVAMEATGVCWRPVFHVLDREPGAVSTGPAAAATTASGAIQCYLDGPL
jgi:hypothetical protein